MGQRSKFFETMPAGGKLSRREAVQLLHHLWDAQQGGQTLRLTPEQQQQLDAALPPNQQRTLQQSWGHVARALAEAQPLPLPRSVAAQVTADIALSQLLTPLPPPASVTAKVARDIALAQELQPVAMPRSVAAATTQDIALAKALSGALSPQTPTEMLPPASLAASLSQSIAAEAAGMASTGMVSMAPPTQPQGAATALRTTTQAANTQAVPHTAPPDLRRAADRAPAILVGSLVASLLLLTLTTAWPSLSAGSSILAGVLAQMPTSFIFGATLLLAASGFIATHPQPRWQRAGAAAFAVAAALTLPPLYSIGSGFGITLGQDVVVSGVQRGPIVAIAGDIVLQAESKVEGDVFSLLGDVRQATSAQVSGQATALLGEVTDAQPPARPQPQLFQAVQLASAKAVAPILGWLGGAAWGWLFWLLTTTLTLGLFITGHADKLAKRQAQAPLPTLAAGTLALLGLLGATTLLSLTGWLAPALATSLLLILLVALGLSVTAFDAGRLVAQRLHAKLPDRVGVVLALLALAGVLAYPAVTLALIVVAAPWGVGTLAFHSKATRQQPTASASSKNFSE